MGSFFDSIRSFFNELANTRAAVNQNSAVSHSVPYNELRAVYKTGLGNKITRLKAGYALNDTLQFDNTQDQEYFEERLMPSVHLAVEWMLAFGRGIIVLYEEGEDLALPRRGAFDPETVKCKVFSGDMVTAISPSLDLMDDRYYMPTLYSVRGRHFHYTRVIDFTYIEPPEQDKPEYQYGGISEFELIWAQLINDGVVERAAPAILEKNSTLFYRVKGFKQALADKKHDDMLKYFSVTEDRRSIYGAGLIDAEDEAFTVDQTLTNLNDADMITLRRLAMVTGIPLAMLVGENVKGLNSTGDNELRAFQEGVNEPLQRRFVLPPVAQLARKLNLSTPQLKENQGRTPEDRIAYEKEALQNALVLWQMGEDHQKYLEDRDVIQRDNWRELFEEPDEEPAPEPDQSQEPIDLASLLGGDDGQA